MRNVIRGTALLVGLLAALLGAFTALLAVTLAVLAGDTPPLSGLTIAFSLAAVGVGLGLPLAAAAWGSWQKRPSPALRLPPAWLLSLAFFLLLGLGQLVLRTSLRQLLLPPLHVIASALPPLIVIAAITPALQRGGAGLTRRHLATQLAYGGLVGALLALTLEAGAVLAAFSAAGVAVALTPGGEESLLRLASELQSPVFLAHPDRVLGRLLSPALVMSAALLVAAAVPLIEETVKSLGAVANRQVSGHLQRAQFFAFGVMAGVGFSLIEALFYGAQQLPHGWAPAVAVRALTAVIHGAATGLFALGWYEALAGRPVRFFPYAAASVGLHALWNGLGGLALLGGIVMLEGSPGALMVGEAITVLAVVLLAVAWLAALAALAVLTQRLSAAAKGAGGPAAHGR